MGRKLALLIATHDYQDKGLRRLEAPAADAEALAAVLRDPAIAGFDVTILINEPHYVVGEAIADFYRGHRHDDLTLLYFTGHGLKDDDGRLYLAMSNTRRDSLLFTSLPAEQLDQAMQASRSRRVVLILDCCYSGAFRAGATAKADDRAHSLETLQGRGRTVLTASDAMQYSFEGDQLHGAGTQSVFTRCLVEGLRSGSADLDHDGNITLDELYTYVHDRVIDEMPQQRPKKQDNVEGRTIIARNINWQLPDHLRQALNSPIATERLAALHGLTHLYRIGNELVRGCVRDEMHRLAEDDSRAVSTAAATQLHSLNSKPPQEAEKDPLREREERAGAREAEKQARRKAEEYRPTMVLPAVPSMALPPRRTRVSPAFMIAIGMIAIGVGLTVVLGRVDTLHSQGGNADPTSGLMTPPDPVPYPTAVLGSVVAVGQAVPTTIDIYEDFLCPPCRSFQFSNSGALTQAITDGKVQVRYHPVAVIDNMSTPPGYSNRAANAAICAAEAGVFLAFQDKLLTDQPREGSAGLSDQQLIAMGQDVGAQGTFAQCVSAEQHSKAVADETTRAENDISLRAPGGSAFPGVPLVIVNGRWTDWSKSDWQNNLPQ